MSTQNNSIRKKDNPLLYFLDISLDKLVIIIVTAVRFFVPRRFQAKYDNFTEHKEMLHNVVGLAFFNAIGGLCVMTTQVKLANYLGVSIYGVYSYCLAIGEVGAMIVRYGRNKTMVRDLIQYPGKRDSLVANTFVLSIINLILFFIIIFACHKPLDIKVNWTYFLLILSPCFLSLTLDPVYESLRMMSWSSIYGFLQKFVVLAVIWGLVFFHFKVELLTIGIISAVAWIAVVSIEYYEVGTQLHIRFLENVKLKELWNLYKDNFVIFLSCVTGVAFGPLIRIILKNYTDSTSVGIYAAGLQIYSICLFLNTQIARVGNPMMAEVGKANCHNDRRKSMVMRYAIVMLATSLPFAVPMIVCPKFVVGLLFTDEYAILANYLPILGIYMLAIAIGVVFTQYMISLRMDIAYFTIYISAALTTVIVAYLLIPAHGVMGAFLALCVPHSIACLGYGIVSMKHLGRNEYKRKNNQ